MKIVQNKRFLGLAIAVALLAPGMAMAQTAKEKELEARIALLEGQVQALLSAQQQQQASLADTRTQLDQVRTPQAAAADGKPKIQSTPILPSGNPDSRFSFGGFIKLDAMVTDTDAGEIPDGSAGRMFYLPGAIPVGGADESSTDFDTHAQFSRFWFAADGDVQGHKTRAYLEFDLFGGGSNILGNQASTNTHGLTVRQAYVTWDKWLAGQTWSNFQDVAALPDAVDFVGPTEGTVFVRQAQLRYTNGPFSVSVENPQTVVGGYRSTARTVSDDGSVPDVTARWTRAIGATSASPAWRGNCATRPRPPAPPAPVTGSASRARSTCRRKTTSATWSPAARASAGMSASRSAPTAPWTRLPTTSRKPASSPASCRGGTSSIPSCAAT